MDFQKYDDIFNKKNYPEFEVTTNPKKSILKERNYIPSKYKPCVCLSGRKYKFCCEKDIKTNKKNRKVKNVKEQFRKLYFRENKKLISSKVEKKSVEKKNISYCSAVEIFPDCDIDNKNRHSQDIKIDLFKKELDIKEKMNI